MNFGEMTSKAKILVLFANAYDMTDDKGKRVCGCSVHYLFWGEDGEQLATVVDFDSEKPVGVQRAKCSAAKELRNKISAAPAIYEGTFTMSVGGDGKPTLKLIDVAYLSNVAMTAVSPDSRSK